jgi:hypothetical protein
MASSARRLSAIQSATGSQRASYKEVGHGFFQGGLVGRFRDEPGYLLVVSQNHDFFPLSFILSRNFLKF